MKQYNKITFLLVFMIFTLYLGQVSNARTPPRSCVVSLHSYCAQWSLCDYQNSCLPENSAFLDLHPFCEREICEKDFVLSDPKCPVIEQTKERCINFQEKTAIENRNRIIKNVVSAMLIVLSLTIIYLKIEPVRKFLKPTRSKIIIFIILGLLVGFILLWFFNMGSFIIV